MNCIRRLVNGLAVVAIVSLAIGCTGPRTRTTKTDTDEHPIEGPHHGTLAEWGSNHEYHVEFTVDHAKQEARVYILGPDAKKPAPIKADKVLLSIKKPAFQVELKPEPQKGDPAGTASCFVGKHEKLGEKQEFQGTISAEVGGKPYAGDFKEEAHDHKHDKK